MLGVAWGLSKRRSTRTVPFLQIFGRVFRLSLVYLDNNRRHGIPAGLFELGFEFGNMIYLGHGILPSSWVYPVRYSLLLVFLGREDLGREDKGETSV